MPTLPGAAVFILFVIPPADSAFQSLPTAAREKRISIGAGEFVKRAKKEGKLSLARYLPPIMIFWNETVL